MTFKINLYYKLCCEQEYKSDYKGDKYSQKFLKFNCLRKLNLLSIY